MRTWWRRVAGAAALLLGLATMAPAAVTWTVVNDTDCTGLGAATGIDATAPIPCCRTAAAGGGNYCSLRMTADRFFWRNVTLVAPAAGTYTTGGDALVAAQMAKIGMQNVLGAICSGTSGASGKGGQDVNWVWTAPTTGYAYGAKVQLYQSGCVGTATILNGCELGSGAALADISTTCLLFGY